MPGAKVFIDSNVLLYTHDRRDLSKFAIARNWLDTLAARSLACVNLQVLNECTHILLRKKWFQASADVFQIIDGLRALGDSPVGWTTIEKARSLHERFGYSWWDSLLLASALELGCTHCVSEDLRGGQAVQGLTIVDPFSTSPGDILSSL